MELTAIILARVLAFVDVSELNPRGKVFLAGLVPAIVDRFNFQQWPSKPEDFDEDAGVSFKVGYMDGHTIDELTIYSDGIKIDVRSSTSNGRDILKDALGWLAEEHGLAYGPHTIGRWAYVSNVVFRSEANLDVVNPAITILKNGIAAAMAGDIRVLTDFHVDSVSIDLDRTLPNKQMVSFLIQRRAKTAASEGKYFSTAPLETHVHLALLEEFERNMKTQA